MTTFSRKITAALAYSSIGASTVAGATGEAMDLGTKVAADPSSRPHIQSARNVMTEPVSRSELNSEIRVLKAEAETVRVGLDAKLDKALEAIAGIAKDMGEFRKELRDEVKSENNMTRWSIWGLGGVTIAVVLAVIALAYNAQGNMTTANGNVLSAFAAGQAASEQREAPAPAPGGNGN